MRRLLSLLLAAGAVAMPALGAVLGSGVDLAGVDRAVAPGDDFDGYANGGWRKATTIRPDRAEEGVFRTVADRAEERTAALIQGAGAAGAGGDARKIADYYAAFLDSETINRRGLAPLKPGLVAIAAIGDRRQLSTALGAALRADADPINATDFWTENLFGLFVTQGLETPDTTMAYLLQGGLGLPDRDYYLSPKPEMAKIRGEYRAYVADLLRLAGLPDAEARAARIGALETRIAQAQVDITSSQDAHNARVWAASEFAALAPGIDWDAFFGAAGLSGQRHFYAWQPMAVSRLAGLVGSEPLEAWKDWLAFHYINQRTSVLPRAIDDRRFAFYGKALSGVPQQRPRPKRAIQAVNAALGDAVGKLYAQRYFPPAAKAEVQAMVANVVAALDARLAADAWLAPATRAEARAKLKATYVGVGYPETWRDYAGLAVRRDDAFGNLDAARLFEYRHQLGKLGRPVDRHEWWMTPQTVNAVNLPLQIALNFPAAILQPPFFDPKADAAANYGSIGATIGHEISHTFDNLGSDFDASGRLRNWWTPADLAHFQASGAALVKQYNGYEALPGLHVSGERTLGENIADLAGLGAALDAYHASLNGRPAPVIDGLTGDQRFFLAFAQSWREKSRDEALRMQMATDVHAPAAQRAQTVRNLDAWYPAFKVTPGQRLYLAPEARVRVW